MSNINIIRAWKDAEYRNSLSAEELAMIPDNPAGVGELKDEDLASIVGGNPVSQVVYLSNCGGSGLLNVNLLNGLPSGNGLINVNILNGLPNGSLLVVPGCPG